MKKFLFLLPVAIHRMTGWLPFQPKPGKVSFANIGAGRSVDGVKSFMPYYATAADWAGCLAGEGAGHFLLWCPGTLAGTVTLTTAVTSCPMGSSEDAVSASTLAATAAALLAGGNNEYQTPTATNSAVSTTNQPSIGVQLFGAVTGTVKVIADGSAIVNGSLLSCSAVATYAGAVALLVPNGSVAGTTYCVGRAVIGPDEGTPAAGDVIEMIPAMPFTVPNS
jgi:hypothetical protein